MVLLRKSHLSYRRHFKTQTSSLYEKKNAVFCLQPFSFHRYSSFKICKKWGWSYIFDIFVCFKNWIQPFLKPLRLEVVVWLIRRSGEGRGREVFRFVTSSFVCERPCACRYIGSGRKMALRIVRKLQANYRKFPMICTKDTTLKTLTSFSSYFFRFMAAFASPNSYTPASYQPREVSVM